MRIDGWIVHIIWTTAVWKPPKPDCKIVTRLERNLYRSVASKCSPAVDRIPSITQNLWYLPYPEPLSLSVPYKPAEWYTDPLPEWTFVRYNSTLSRPSPPLSSRFCLGRPPPERTGREGAACLSSLNILWCLIYGFHLSELSQPLLVSCRWSEGALSLYSRPINHQTNLLLILQPPTSLFYTSRFRIIFFKRWLTFVSSVRNEWKRVSEDENQKSSPFSGPFFLFLSISLWPPFMRTCYISFSSLFKRKN